MLTAHCSVPDVLFFAKLTHKHKNMSYIDIGFLPVRSIERLDRAPHGPKQKHTPVSPFLDHLREHAKAHKGEHEGEHEHEQNARRRSGTTHRGISQHTLALLHQYEVAKSAANTANDSVNDTDPLCTLFVGRIKPQTSDDQIRSALAAIGVRPTSLRRVRRISRVDKKKSRERERHGCAFVGVANAREAKQAAAIAGTIRGRAALGDMVVDVERGRGPAAGKGFVPVRFRH
jgi:hypothetical protein